MQCVSIETDASIDLTKYERVSLQEDGSELPLRRRKTHRKMETIVDGIGVVDDVKRVENLTLRDRMQMSLDGVFFQAVMASFILLNAAVIGGETDFPDLEIWRHLENVFLLIFLLELLIRMLAAGLVDFFASGDDQIWNLFDLTVVGLGIFDWVCEQLNAQSTHPKHEDRDSEHSGQHRGVSTLFRMIRLLRILRVFKIVRFLKQLYMISHGFLEAIQAICMVTMLMLIIIYLCSVVMVRTYGRISGEHPNEDAKLLIYQFSTVKTSMLSLFELMSNPGNLVTYHEVMRHDPTLALFLIVFVIFGSFGMAALLTGVISESMFDKNQARVQEVRQDLERKRDILKQKCIELFHLVEKNAEDECLPEDLEEVLPYVRDVFDRLDIDYRQHEFTNIIAVCDTDGNGGISEQEFVTGIMLLCDGVRAASIQEVYYLVSQMNAQVTKHLPHKFQLLQDEVHNITRKTIPELQVQMSKIAESKTTPQPPPISGGFSSAVSQGTESYLSELKASMSGKVDEQTELMGRKIDDLTSKFKELCCRQDFWNGHVFTLPEVESTSMFSADVESSLVFPDTLIGQLESTAKGAPSHSPGSGQHDNNRCIIPLSPPPHLPVAAAGALPVNSPAQRNDYQHIVPLSSPIQNELNHRPNGRG